MYNYTGNFGDGLKLMDVCTFLLVNFKIKNKFINNYLFVNF